MDILTDAFLDTGKLVPLLGAVYFIVAFLEFRYGDRMGDFITRFGPLGPVAGSLFGCIPQCGFSVVASALYARGMISAGTLLAVFLSTSDEAVPVLLSVPGRAGLVLTLIAVKAVIAAAAGMTIDFVFGRRRAASREKIAHAGADEHGCCSHELSGPHSKIRALLVHPILHTIKIFVFLFVLTAAFGFIVNAIGPEGIGAIMLRGSVLQPVLAALIGLVPSCFTSVLLAGLFVKGVIGFGSLVAGLCAGCGLGLLVLIKENRDRADTLRIIGLLLAVSVIAGVVIH